MNKTINKIAVTFFIVIVSMSINFKSNIPQEETVCLSMEEKELYELIMKYRKEKKLPSIPLSVSLTKVAQLHSKDLSDFPPDNKPCNPHSWSSNGKWKACCYYPDHSTKECMWDKPKEITAYPGSGYEIAYYHSDKARPAEALNGWKKSKGHNMVIVNLDIWKKAKWSAIGIGIHKNFATVWFGMEPDPAGQAELCR